MPKITFLPDEISVEVREGATLFLAAIEAKNVDIESQCGGKGGCALCKLIIREGAENLSEMEWEETAHLGNVFHVTHERLACQSRILGDVVVEIPEPIERAKKTYIPHAIKRNREQMLQARLEAEESEQDSTRTVKGRTRRRRRGRGPGPEERDGAPMQGRGRSGQQQAGDGGDQGPPREDKPAAGSDDLPPRGRSRRRGRRRRGGRRGSPSGDTGSGGDGKPKE